MQRIQVKFPAFSSEDPQPSLTRAPGQLTPSSASLGTFMRVVHLYAYRQHTHTCKVKSVIFLFCFLRMWDDRRAAEVEGRRPSRQLVTANCIHTLIKQGRGLPIAARLLPADPEVLSLQWLAGLRATSAWSSKHSSAARRLWCSQMTEVGDRGGHTGNHPGLKAGEQGCLDVARLRGSL